jgi:hypothetical protein
MLKEASATTVKQNLKVAFSYKGEAAPSRCKTESFKIEIVQ